MLFSATMTKKGAKLQRASLKDPVKVEVWELSNGRQAVAVLSLHPTEVQGDLPGAHPQRAGGQLLHDLLQHLQRHPQTFPLAQRSRFYSYTSQWPNESE